MADGHEHTIVVGYDGSAGAQVALDWAAQEARSRGEKLCVIQAWTSGEYGNDADLEAYTEQQLKQQMADMLKDDGVKWEAKAIKGSAGKVLVDEAADADMLVVGSRGRPGLKGLLLGSVSRHVSTHATAPVVVIVRSDQDGSNN